MNTRRSRILRGVAVDMISRRGWPREEWRRLHRTLKRYWIRTHSYPTRIERHWNNDRGSFFILGDGGP